MYIGMNYMESAFILGETLEDVVHKFENCFGDSPDRFFEVKEIKVQRKFEVIKEE